MSEEKKNLENAAHRQFCRGLTTLRIAANEAGDFLTREQCERLYGAISEIDTVLREWDGKRT